MAQVILLPPKGEEGEPKVFALSEKFTTIGRTPASHIHITDKAASRKHCMIKVVGDTYTLVDLGAANGTKVNGDRVQREFDLTQGDRIQIGKTVLVFKEEDH